MPNLTERITSLLAQRGQERQLEEKKTQEEKEIENEKLRGQLETCKRTLNLIKPEELLNEINDNFLSGRGEIKREEGVFEHQHYHSPTHSEYEDGYWYTVVHPLSIVSLLWSEGKHKSREGFTLSIGVGIDMFDNQYSRVLFGGEKLSIAKEFCDDNECDYNSWRSKRANHYFMDFKIEEHTDVVRETRGKIEGELVELCVELKERNVLS